MGEQVNRQQNKREKDGERVTFRSMDEATSHMRNLLMENIRRSS